MLKSRIDTIARSLDEEIDVAMRYAAEAIATGAQSRVAVDSGDLKEAIHVEKHGEGSYSVVAGNSDVFYGHMVENGTTRTPARPFLIPAVEAERDNVDELVRHALKDI